MTLIKRELPESPLEDNKIAKIADSIMVAGLKRQLYALQQDYQIALGSLSKANGKIAHLENLIENGHQPFPCWFFGLHRYCERAKIPPPSVG